MTVWGDCVWWLRVVTACDDCEVTVWGDCEVTVWCGYVRWLCEVTEKWLCQMTEWGDCVRWLYEVTAWRLTATPRGCSANAGPENQPRMNIHLLMNVLYKLVTIKHFELTTMLLGCNTSTSKQTTGYYSERWSMQNHCNHMKSSFPKRHKCQSKKSILQCQCQIRKSYFGKDLFINMYIYTHICLWEKLFTEAQSLNLALALQAHFLDWRLTHF